MCWTHFMKLGRERVSWRRKVGTLGCIPWVWVEGCVQIQYSFELEMSRELKILFLFFLFFSVDNTAFCISEVDRMGWKISDFCDPTSAGSSEWWGYPASIFSSSLVYNFHGRKVCIPWSAYTVGICGYALTTRENHHRHILHTHSSLLGAFLAFSTHLMAYFIPLSHLRG